MESESLCDKDRRVACGTDCEAFLYMDYIYGINSVNFFLEIRPG